MRLSKKQARIIIIVLAILLGLSVTALVGTWLHNYYYAGSGRDSVVVPDNLVTPDKESTPAETGGAEPTAEPTQAPAATEPDEPDEPSQPAETAAPTEAPSETVAPPVDAVATAETPATQATKAPANQPKAAVLSLYKRHETDNEPFQVTNMFPGDVETKYFCVRVSHEDEVTVHFRTDLHDGSEKLAEVLKCRVVLLTTGETLYEGLMRDMPKDVPTGLAASSGGTSELYYEITAYLDTSVGNEYQDKNLLADFVWWTEGELKPPPQTGDMAAIGPLICLAAVSAAGLVVLVLIGGKRRREEDTNG